MATSNYPMYHSGTPGSSNKTDAGDTLKDGVTGHDKPMEQKHPTAPFALVFASYPIALAIAVVFFIIMYWVLS